MGGEGGSGGRSGGDEWRNMTFYVIALITMKVITPLPVSIVLNGPNYDYIWACNSTELLCVTHLFRCPWPFWHDGLHQRAIAVELECGVIYTVHEDGCDPLPHVTELKPHHGQPDLHLTDKPRYVRGVRPEGCKEWWVDGRR